MDPLFRPSGSQQILMNVQRQFLEAFEQTLYLYMNRADPVYKVLYAFQTNTSFESIATQAGLVRLAQYCMLGDESIPANEHVILRDFTFTLAAQFYSNYNEPDAVTQQVVSVLVKSLRRGMRGADAITQEEASSFSLMPMDFSERFIPAEDLAKYLKVNDWMIPIVMFLLWARFPEELIIKPPASGSAKGRSRQSTQGE